MQAHPKQISAELQEAHQKCYERLATRGGWLQVLASRPWDCFATLTYRIAAYVPREKAERDVGRWLYLWCREQAVTRGLARVEPWERRDGYGRIVGKGENARGVWASAWRRDEASARPVYAVGFEDQQRGQVHMHAVIQSPSMLGELERRVGWRLWFEKHGFARLLPPRNGGVDAARYVTKYAVKGGDVVLSDSFRPLTNIAVGSPGQCDKFASR